MFPTVQQAQQLLNQAHSCNPGPWADHSRVAAHCAQKIAGRCAMDPEKAQVLGLLHDIGRKFGTRHLGHVVDGYRYMLELGYPDVARICLTHSFSGSGLAGYIGRIDITDAEMTLLTDALAAAVPDEYDLLIRLCDALAGPRSVVDLRARMEDVARRYGCDYPQEKREYIFWLKAHFEAVAGDDNYKIVEKDSFSL